MSMSSGTQPPGWYDDGSGTVRWWDGSTWTYATQDAATPNHQAYGASDDPSASVPSPGTDPGTSAHNGRAPLVLGIVGTVILVSAGAVVLWLLVFRGDDGPEAVASDWLYADSCADAGQYLTEHARDQNQSWQAEDDPLCCFSEFFYSDVEFDTVAEGDNTATVEVSLVQHYSGSVPDVPSAESGTITLELVTEDGGWLISEVQWCREGADSEECR